MPMALPCLGRFVSSWDLMETRKDSSSTLHITFLAHIFSPGLLQPRQCASGLSCLWRRTCQKVHGWWIPAAPVIVQHVLGGLFFPRNSGNCYDTSDDCMSKAKRKQKEREKELDKRQAKGEGDQQPDPCGGWFSMLAAKQQRQHHYQGQH